ncbi:MAG TPA: LON peptidase substrate-binding domain-containing protein [Planctomycetota bacterium]|nr:LON peptidase substrate-binding domain-containing protein [Planctomycetota bacterium]
MSASLPSHLEVPLFPLPGVVLFPGAVLPLRVFEPRYVQLLNDVLATDKLIGMPQIQPGRSHFSDSPELPAPPLTPIFGVGLVIAHQAMDDGTHHIALLGQSRCRLESEVPHQPYRIGRARTIKDRIPEDTQYLRELKDQHRKLEEMGEAVMAKTLQGETSQHLKKAMADRHEPGPMADLLASVYVPDAHLKQLLLETVDVRARVGLVCAVLEKLLCRLEPKEPAFEYRPEAVVLN